jgi:D-sedoheptulose 7-phosphate isomerase
MQKISNNIDRFYTEDVVKFSFNYFKYLKEVIDKVDLDSIARFISILLEARENNANIFFIGNGGSASTSSHFANDLAIGTNQYIKSFRAISLTDNLSVITAIANDYGYEEIFTRQLKVIAKKGDVLVGISASGNSKNLLNAFEFANKNEIKTVAITGFDGGALKLMSYENIHIPTENGEYGPVEDLHMILDHLVGAYLMRIAKNA